MGEFLCRVADANGRVFSHVEAAGTKDEARQKMADRGLYVYSVEARNSLMSGLTNRSRVRQVTGSDFLILNQQFNTLIKAGLPILRALDLLSRAPLSPNAVRWSPRFATACEKGSLCRRPSTRREFFPRCIPRPSWPVKKAATFPACWSTTLPISA